MQRVRAWKVWRFDRLHWWCYIRKIVPLVRCWPLRRPTGQPQVRGHVQARPLLHRWCLVLLNLRRRAVPAHIGAGPVPCLPGRKDVIRRSASFRCNDQPQ